MENIKSQVHAFELFAGIEEEESENIERELEEELTSKI